MRNNFGLKIISNFMGKIMIRRNFSLSFKDYLIYPNLLWMEIKGDY